MPEIIEPSFPTPQYYLTLHCPGDQPDIVREIHPSEVTDGVSVDLSLLTGIARGMRVGVNAPSARITFDIRQPSHQPDFSDGSRLQAFADERVIVDLEEKLISIDGRSRTIPPKEFALVALLSSRVNHAWPHDYLAQQIWGGYATRTSLKTSVCKLRSYLGPELSPAIATRIRVGYVARSSLVG